MIRVIVFVCVLVFYCLSRENSIPNCCICYVTTIANNWRWCMYMYARMHWRKDQLVSVDCWRILVLSFIFFLGTRILSQLMIFPLPSHMEMKAWKGPSILEIVDVFSRELVGEPLGFILALWGAFSVLNLEVRIYH